MNTQEIKKKKTKTFINTENTIWFMKSFRYIRTSNKKLNTCEYGSKKKTI